MIVWGGILNVSIGALFLAGILPGLLIGLAQMATVHAYAVARGYQTYPKATWRDLASSLFVSIPALVTPGIIIGGKLFGWFTATESGCVAVLYGALLALLVYREMDLAGLKYALLDTGKLAGITLFCVGTASVFGWLLAYYQIPRAILSGVAEWGMGPIATGFFIAAVFLVVGCFLDAIPAIIIVGTILSPVAAAAGLDPVHFAMIGIVSLAFGLVTPPYGLCLLIACSIAGIRMTAALKDTMIMLIPMLAVLALVILWPGLVLLIPSFATPGSCASRPPPGPARAPQRIVGSGTRRWECAGGSDAGGGCSRWHGARRRPQTDVHAMFDQAERDGRVGLARKTRPVDVRAAQPGEVVVTVIAGEGKETQSPPAQPGDMVVRNRCPETGNEAILVSAAKFAERYEGRSGRPMRRLAAVPPARHRDGLFRRARRRWRVHLHRALGRADGGAPWRRDRARPARPGGHLSDRRRRVRVHLRDPAAGALSRYCRTMGSARINALFEAWIVARPHEQCFQNRWPKSTRRRVLRSALAGADAGGLGATQADGRDAARAASGGVRSIV